MEMSKQTVMWAAVVGLAGVFAWSATSIAAPKPKAAGAQNVSYETLGAQRGMAPPVPGFALAGYKPGLCYKVHGHARDSQLGQWIPCSQFKKE
jgi:hypothetical protein